MDNKHRRGCSTITREMQSKTTMKYQLTSIRMATIKQQTNKKKPENSKCWLERMWRNWNAYALLVGV